MSIPPPKKKCIAIELLSLNITCQTPISPLLMTSHAFFLDFIVRDGDNFAQFFFTIITTSFTIVPKLLGLTITIFEISDITWLPFRFYCT